MVRANGAVSLRELARVVQTSEVTVRRDVRALEAEGLLDRRHGGAVLPGGFTRESGFPQKSHLATAEKTAIADLAASLVEEGEAVVVGAGTTTQELARRLARIPGLTVVTNSLLVAQALAHANRVEVVMTGGTLRGSNYALVGSGAEQSLQGLRVTRAFLSGSGLTAERGLSTSNMLSASVDRALVQAAAEVVVLADHTKLGTDTMFQTVPTDLISRLVTDEPPAHDDRAATELQALADQGVQIAVAGGVGGAGGAGSVGGSSAGAGAGAGSGSVGGAGGSGGEAHQAGRQSRRDVPLPGQRRTHAAGPGPGQGPGSGGPGSQLRSAAASLAAQEPGERARVADLRPDGMIYGAYRPTVGMRAFARHKSRFSVRTRTSSDPGPLPPVVAPSRRAVQRVTLKTAASGTKVLSPSLAVASAETYQVPLGRSAASFWVTFRV